MTENKLAKYEPRHQDAALLKEGTATFLPPIKLMSGMSKPVKARPPKAKIGDWFMGKETNLGEETEFVVIEGLPHALQMDENGQKVVRESFDPNDKDFQEIKAGRAKYLKGYGWGFNYLLWSPKARGFGVYFCQKSAKIAASEFEDRLGKYVSATSYEKSFNTGNTAMIPKLQTLDEEPKVMFSDADLASALDIFRNSKPRQAGAEGEVPGDPDAAPATAGGRKGRAK